MSLSSNVNLVFIYTFVIQSFYDEPKLFSEKYIYILNQLVNENNGSTIHSPSTYLKDFFNQNNINKLKIKV